MARRHETPLIITVIEAARKRNSLPFSCNLFGVMPLTEIACQGTPVQSQVARVAIRNNGFRCAVLINHRWRD